MRNIGLLAFLAFAALSQANSGEFVCGKEASAARLFAANPAAKPSRVAVETWDDTDVLSNTLDIEVTHATQNITGFNRMSIKSLKEDLGEFTFRLADTFTISSIALNGRPITFSRLDPVTVRATFDQTYDTDQIFELKINYGGPATAGAGFGSIVFTTQNSQPLVFTLSEPYYSYTWWPSKDDNDDKALNSISVTMPTSYKVAASGKLVSTSSPGIGVTKWNYVCTYPMVDYLLCFSATNYNTWSKTYNYSGGSMPVNFMIFPASDTTSNRTAWEACIPMIGVFEQKYGPYPFRNDQYGIYHFGFGGGMEHQTYSGQGGFGESLTAHELAHQWWGDMVTCKYWMDIWLNEGFATYSEALWLQYKSGSTGWPALKSAMAARKPTAYTGTVYRTDTSSTNTIFSSNYAYRKGGWVLHMLRKVVGETIFWETLAEWRNRYAYQSATTADFIQTSEDVYGQDLNWFFDPWIFQPGALVFRQGWQNTTVNGKTYTMLRIEQIQSASYPTYTMPVDISATVGGSPVPFTQKISARSQWYLLPVSGATTALTLDPDGWLLTSAATTSTTYVPGPPKIIDVGPVSTAKTFPGYYKVTFHTPVNATSADFQMKTRDGRTIRCTVVSEPATNSYYVYPTVDFLPKGAKLTVRDTVTAVNSGLALDGEWNGNALPTGDGLPGGSAVVTL